MRHIVCFVCAMIVITCLPGLAGAEVYTFKPDDGGTSAANSDGTSNMANDLWDLDHGKYYEWGIDWALPAEETIVGASLFFDDIRNWNDGENDLWVHLLDSVSAGARQFSDTAAGQVDHFDGKGVLLNHWEDLPSTAQDITYDFDADELLALTNYVADGNFGFGFDPDCHFYNNGITLTIETQTVPLPGALLLGGLGLSSAAAALRRRRRA